ncbi:MAG: hypothetical protein RSA80_05455 [Lachnospiraceae bacterium]
MVNLTFGEQVKIVLKRKNMTIKELAEIIEIQTGRKMSRQNLTQRLGRDNFQEKDMRIIADILGCPFQLNILRDTEIEEKLSLEGVSELQNKNSAQQKKKHNSSITEREVTIGELAELYDFNMGNNIEEKQRNDESVEMIEPAKAGTKEEIKKVINDEIKEEKQAEITEQIVGISEMAEETKKTQKSEKAKETVVIDYLEKPEEKPEAKKEIGDVNPYTGREYESNSVRMHAKRIGYVQVYDKNEHKWTDMTEWAFLGYQERKKALLGKAYKPPIYLD